MADLNLLYSPSRWSKRMSADTIVDNHGKVMLEKSEHARENVAHKTIRFGDANENVFQVFSRHDSMQKIDENSLDSLDLDAECWRRREREVDEKLYSLGHPIFVYLHGGYWQWGSVYSSSFMAENFTRKGITVVALGYEIAPSCDMNAIVLQVEKGVARILKAAEKSKSKVFICGHSAGAHLAAMMLYVDFEAKYQTKANQLAGLVFISGIFDLTPLIQTDINDNLRMDLEIARKLSPILRDDIKITRDVEILFAYGENDTPAFKEQSHDYEKLLRSTTTHSINFVHIPECDHFDVTENLSLDDYSLTQEIYKMIL